MKTSIKKCNFDFEELKSLGHIVFGLTLGIEKNKVEAVLLEPIPQNKKEMMSFIGFAIHYRKNLKYFAILAKSLYRIHDQETVFEMTQEKIKAYEKIMKALTEAPLLLMPDLNIPSKFYIDAFGYGLGEANIKSELLMKNPQKVSACDSKPEHKNDSKCKMCL
ncbi:hypothetical protein O181_085993 [Austropuccinia psidii MF-1]|uniref:Reverse transcriptase/retrotransposon-derived protein RNase H-like domain-containing protein n=1 Tax=Austropuccinia psidii MF-1 TaxID=1389203 RepID=A0A9Q3ILX5_9BASI|nr:hypothetical protein [Austropuccinia psidii MF-1]